MSLEKFKIERKLIRKEKVVFNLRLSPGIAAKIERRAGELGYDKWGRGDNSISSFVERILEDVFKDEK